VGLSYQGLAALVILLPGFLTAGLVQTLSSRPQRSELDKIIEALLYSFLIYVAFAATHALFPMTLRVVSERGIQSFVIEFHFIPLALLAALAVALALAVAAMITNDFPLSLLRTLRITQRTSRISVWSDTFHLMRGYVQVELADGRQLIGWLRYYSDTPEESSLMLEDAAWIGTDGNEIPVDGPGMLLTKESGIRTIMFLNPTQNSASHIETQSQNPQPIEEKQDLRRASTENR
jgi:hypothetical protein